MSDKKHKLKYIKHFLGAALCAVLLFPELPIYAAAEADSGKERVIVSLGDSYSSGEGIEPFFGQNTDTSKKVKNQDWLAHRSQNAWPGMLTLPSVDGTMSRNRGTHWYFTAVSGAVADNLYNAQTKEYKKSKYSGSCNLPPQLDIFDELGDKEADYVTLTLGGNDADFSGIITDVVTGSTYLNLSNLSDKLNKTWEKFYEEGGIEDKLRRAYGDIAEKAGSQAHIIVAGYPKLLDSSGKGFFVSREEATLVNTAVSNFNNAIEHIVNQCSDSGMNISFVSVEDAFEGHGAYSDDPYINEIIFGTKSQDLKDFGISSAYSIHPNYSGAKAYARCVQDEIDTLEGLKPVVYSTDFNISTLGYDGALYDDYKIIVEGRESIALWGLIGRDYYDEITVDEAKPVSMSLPKGTYTITVTDGEASYFQKIKTRKNSENNLLIFTTNFGYVNEADNASEGQYQEAVRTTSEERDIVLVLDVSGSMSGEPIAETKKASVNFIDTILDRAASIGIVAYDNDASMLSDFSVDKNSLTDIVANIYDGGGTNIEAGLAKAYSMLGTSGAKKKIIVLMSDGEPNDGKEGDALIDYAGGIKDDNVIIYTLGFFESLGSNKSSAQKLMEGIASDGCHYEVASADDLVFFFEDVADQINGQKYIYIRIACPVDVTVSYNGETLCSAEDNLNLRTDFGTLTFEQNENGSGMDEDDRIKVLRLKEGAAYDVQIVGTGHGLMDYTIGFMDENGDYSDFRRFEEIKITRETVIDTVAEVSEETTLNIDENGDGRYDLKMCAGENGYGEEVKGSVLIYAAGAVFLILLILFFIVRKKIKRQRRSVKVSRYCGNCGTKLEDNAKICGQCGTPFEETPANISGLKTVNPQKKGFRKTVKRAAAVVVIIAVGVIAVTIAMRFTGYNGVLRRTMTAYKKYDIDALISLSGDMYYYGAGDWAEHYFENSVGEDLDFFEASVGHSYKVSYEVNDIYTLSERRLAKVLDEIENICPDFDVSIIKKVVVAELTVTARQGDKSVSRDINIFMSKENGSWRLLYIE